MKKVVLLAFVSMFIVSSAIIANASSEPRLIWSSGTINGTICFALQVIPDINGDGHEDVFVASTPGGRTYDDEIVYSVYLALIDGKSGSIIRASDPIDYSNMYLGREVAVYINGYIVLAIVTENVDVYDLQFNKLYSIPITPPGMPTLGGLHKPLMEQTSCFHIM